MTTRIVVLLLTAMMLSSFVSAQDRTPEVRHQEIKFQIARVLTSSAVVTSEVIAVPLDRVEPFLAVGAAWVATGDLRLELRNSTDGVNWSEWLPMSAHSDNANERGEQVSALALLDRQTKFVQYRISAKQQSTISSLQLVFISPGATPREMQQRIQQRANEAMTTETLQQPKYPKPPIVTRTEWGCPDGQITTHGSLSYTTVTHLIVHHTFSPSGAINGDWAAAVRSVRRSWPMRSKP